jgi:hypothetical protein
MRHDDFETPRLTFSPWAWLKWQYLCHAGSTEVAAFGLSTAFEPMYLDDLLLVRQRATPVTVALDDTAVADLFDQMADAGVPPARFARVWLHTHPGASPDPSAVDEETFARAFGGCDWAVMAILGRTGRTYARLHFVAGPGGTLEVPVGVDWAAWPAAAEGAAGRIGELISTWRSDYDALVERAIPVNAVSAGRAEVAAGGLPDWPGPAFGSREYLLPNFDPFLDGGPHEFE